MLIKDFNKKPVLPLIAVEREKICDYQLNLPYGRRVRVTCLPIGRSAFHFVIETPNPQTKRVL